MTIEQLFDDLKQYIDVRFSQILATTPNKDDIKSVATKNDLGDMVVKSDIADMLVKNDISGMVVKSDIAEMVVKSDINGLATREELMATKSDIAALATKMDNGFSEVMSAIADTMTVSNDQNDERLANHEHRITRLERRSA